MQNGIRSITFNLVMVKRAMQQSDNDTGVQSNSTSSQGTLSQSSSQDIASQKGAFVASSWWAAVPVVLLFAWIWLRVFKKSPSGATEVSPLRNPDSRSIITASNVTSDLQAQTDAQDRAAKRKEKANQAFAESKKIVKQRIKEKKKHLKQAKMQNLENARAAALATSAFPIEVPTDLDAVASSNPQTTSEPTEIGQVTETLQPTGWHATAAVQAALRDSQPPKRKPVKSKPAANPSATGFRKFDRQSFTIRQVSIAGNESSDAKDVDSSSNLNSQGPASAKASNLNEDAVNTSSPRTLKDFIGSRSSIDS